MDAHNARINGGILDEMAMEVAEKGEKKNIKCLVRCVDLEIFRFSVDIHRELLIDLLFD